MLIQLARWTARVVGGLLVAMFLWFLTAHALEADTIPSLTLLEGTLLFCMLASLSGMVVLWFHEGWGGLMALAGISAFFVIDAVATGSLPRGWVLPLYFLPGALALIAWAMSRRIDHRVGRPVPDRNCHGGGR